MPVKNKRFVFTGELSKEREYFANLVIMAGGKVTQQVSGVTDYLVIGEDGGKVKMRRAEEMGCKVIREEEFMRMLNEELGKGVGDKIACGKEAVEGIKDGNTINNVDKSEEGIVVKDKIKPRNEKEMVKADGHMEKVMVNGMSTRSDSTGSAYNYADESNYGTLWTVKYEPRSLDEVIGNKTAKEHILSFLEQHTPGKALLIAGPPGVGKSLCVKLACASTGYEMTEFNASDVRNKGSLSERVRQFVNCACISGKRRALVMDECDGMTGDRGGMPELVQIIKNARMPVICICNDKYAVRPLANVCEEVTFRKLETRQILGRIRDILKSEHRAVTDKEIVEVCAMANNDMRYILNCLQGRVMYTKVVSRSLFDEVLALFGRGTAAEKIETFFQDYEMMPMMVYENYLRSEVREDGHVKKDRVNAHKHNKTTKNTRINVYELGESDWHRKMRTYAHASDSISLADTYLRKMGSNDWSLLNQYAVFGALIPTQNIKINRRIEFPKILGNTSKGNKHNKIIQTFHFHILSRCDPTEFYFYDMPLLIKTYIANFNDGHIDKNVQFLVENKLLKSDCDDGMSVYGWEKNVSTKGKSAMTRAYKKLKRSLPYNDDE